MIMTKCKKCGREFDCTDTYIGKKMDRGDGVMYGSVHYSFCPVCPYCGHDNSSRVYIRRH